MSEHDTPSSFVKTPQQLIVVVLLSFIVPVIGIVLLVQLVVGRPAADPATMSAKAIAARIQPVDQKAGPAIAAPQAAAATPAAGGKPDGKKIYDTTCMACHATGAANAPKLGDKAAWAPRIKTGVGALVKSVVVGKTAMPPRAGNASLSDADIRAAVDYLVAQSR